MIIVSIGAAAMQSSKVVAWSGDTKRTLLGVERLAVTFVGEQGFAVGEVGIDFSHGEDDLVAVGGLHTAALRLGADRASWSQAALRRGKAWPTGESPGRLQAYRGPGH